LLMWYRMRYGCSTVNGFIDCESIRRSD